MKSRNTFRHILVAVAPRNIRTLENEARAASALATAYPENKAAFRSLESEALRQIFHIMAATAHGQDAWRIVDKRPDREPVEINLAAD